MFWHRRRLCARLSHMWYGVMKRRKKNEKINFHVSCPWVVSLALLPELTSLAAHTYFILNGFRCTYLVELQLNILVFFFRLFFEICAVLFLRLHILHFNQNKFEILRKIFEIFFFASKNFSHLGRLRIVAEQYRRHTYLSSKLAHTNKSSGKKWNQIITNANS